MGLAQLFLFEETKADPAWDSGRTADPLRADLASALGDREEAAAGQLGGPPVPEAPPTAPGRRIRGRRERLLVPEGWTACAPEAAHNCRWAREASRELWSVQFGQRRFKPKRLYALRVPGEEWGAADLSPVLGKERTPPSFPSASATLRIYLYLQIYLLASQTIYLSAIQRAKVHAFALLQIYAAFGLLRLKLTRTRNALQARRSPFFRRSLPRNSIGAKTSVEGLKTFFRRKERALKARLFGTKSRPSA